MENIKILYNKALCERYPFLKIKNHWEIYGEKVDNEYDTIWLDDLDDGWRKAFGLEMCEELLHILEKADYVNDYTIVQVKEKYGTLRWYDAGIPYHIWEEYHNWCNKYEKLSAYTCIRCGRPATVITKGWISPYCDECIEEMDRQQNNYAKYMDMDFKTPTISIEEYYKEK